MDGTPIIIMCPGQGAQSVGMGRAWFDASEAAARTFGAADQSLGARFEGRTISQLCFEGPEESLNQTDVAQPALFVTAIACHQALVDAAEGPLELAAAAGLSLGEYTALCVAGALSFSDALELVALRGSAMQDAAEAVESGMVALIGADEEQASKLCEENRGDEVLVVANLNAPGQVVISGHASACQRALQAAPQAGLRASPLAVAGAFHSPLMAPAAERLEAALDRVEINAPRCPVLSNVTGRPHGVREEGELEADLERSIRTRLIAQLTSPVRWTDNCKWLSQHVEGDYHELAPGKVLSGLMRRIERSIQVEAHDAPKTAT